MSINWTYWILEKNAAAEQEELKKSDFVEVESLEKNDLAAKRQKDFHDDVNFANKTMTSDKHPKEALYSVREHPTLKHHSIISWNSKHQVQPDIDPKHGRVLVGKRVHLKGNLGFKSKTNEDGHQHSMIIDHTKLKKSDFVEVEQLQKAKLDIAPAAPPQSGDGKKPAQPKKKQPSIPPSHINTEDHPSHIRSENLKRLIKDEDEGEEVCKTLPNGQWTLEKAKK